MLKGKVFNWKGEIHVLTDEVFYFDRRGLCLKGLVMRLLG